MLINWHINKSLKKSKSGVFNTLKLCKYLHGLEKLLLLIQQ